MNTRDEYEHEVFASFPALNQSASSFRPLHALRHVCVPDRLSCAPSSHLRSVLGPSDGHRSHTVLPTINERFHPSRAVQRIQQVMRCRETHVQRSCHTMTSSMLRQSRLQWKQTEKCSGLCACKTMSTHPPPPTPSKKPTTLALCSKHTGFYFSSCLE